MDSAAQPIAVQCYIRSRADQEESIYKLERIWSNEQTEEFRVDDRAFLKSDYEALVESLGFCYTNPYNILQQGKINQVVLMD